MGSMSATALQTPLRTPDGILTLVLINAYSNLGTQRVELQQYIIGIQPATPTNFIQKFDVAFFDTTKRERIVA